MWKIECRTFHKLLIIAFPHSAAKKFRISVDHRTTVRSHCITDVQPTHSSVRHPAVPSFRILCRPFAKERGSCFTISTPLTSMSLPHSKCHVISLVDAIGFNMYNRCHSHTDNRTKPIMFNSCDTGRCRCHMTAVAVATDRRNNLIV